MATPRLTRHTLPGVLGPLLVDVRSGDPAAGRAAVIIHHGFKGFKDWGMFPVLADRLARAGFTAVSFNVSGSGVDDTGEFVFPDRFGRNTYSAELDDLHRVIDALDGGRLGVSRPAAVGLLGHSRGGGIAVLEAARNPRVTALVTWAAIASVDRWSAEARAGWRKRGYVNITNTRTGQTFPLGTEVLDDIERHAGGALDLVAAAGRIRIPWLIVHGDADQSVDIEDARTLARAAAVPGAELVEIAGAGHTFGAVHPFRTVTAELDHAVNRSAAWFGRHLR